MVYTTGNILLWRLIMKYFLWSFSPADSRKAGVSFWRKNVHKYWSTTLRIKPAQDKVWLGKLTVLNMTPLGWSACQIWAQLFKANDIVS